METNSSLTLSVFAEDWIAGQRMRLRPSTWVSYQSVLRNYIVPRFGSTALEDIRARDVNEFYAALLEVPGVRGRPLSERSVGYCHSVLSRMLDAAVLQGMIERNPCWGASPPRQGANRFMPTVWTGAEVATFLQFVDKHPASGLFHLALASGMRRGELLGLNWGDLRPDGSLVVLRSLTEVDGRIVSHPPKNRRPRTLLIDEVTHQQLERHRLWEVLKRHRRVQPDDAMFTDAVGGPCRPNQITHSFRLAVRASGLPVIRFHDLRHTHATLLLASGVPMYVVSARLGHSAKTTLFHYAHVLPATDWDAAERYGSVVANEWASTPTRLPRWDDYIEVNASLNPASRTLRKDAAKKKQAAWRMHRLETSRWS